jgi:hypothetical protein
VVSRHTKKRPIAKPTVEPRIKAMPSGIDDVATLTAGAGQGAGGARHPPPMPPETRLKKPTVVRAIPEMSMSSEMRQAKNPLCFKSD